LIAISIESQVGVLLDEFPAVMRERVMNELLRQPVEAWRSRAARQARLTRLRLNFRDFVYDGFRGQLPLPPSHQWEIMLDEAGPTYQIIQGHELVTVGYTLAATILTDEVSPGLAEPALGEIGGIWNEPFVFPIDPDLLTQRTGNACINEGGFPPNSFDSENYWHLYDFECTADSGGATGCHRTILPNLSCRQALAATVGLVETSVRFERRPWADDRAGEVRFGSVTISGSPDLRVVGEDLETNRIVYRYIEPDDCAIEENAVGGAGWRRLLLFDATIHNIGEVALHVGPVAAEDNVNNVFQYNLCHDHFHYTNYGDFFLDSRDLLGGSKQAFCVQSTDRRSNNETSPLVHEYSCRFQGIQSGWVDEYIAGLDTQWVDITDMKIPSLGRSVELGFASNGDRFLCEGQPVIDENGEQLWERSGFVTEHDEPINRPQCIFTQDWDRNNEATREVFVPTTGSFVTEPCHNQDVGPLRNCDFAPLELAGMDHICQPGQTISVPLKLSEDARPQAVRVCERSSAMGIGVACTFSDSVTNVIVDVQNADVSFACPRMRDAREDAPQGGFALYIAPVWPGDEAVNAVESDGA
jgi:hypothetical protein